MLIGNFAGFLREGCPALFEKKDYAACIGTAYLLWFGGGIWPTPYKFRSWTATRLSTIR